MRYQGKLANWKDEQGFGFVTPNGGGQRAFVHIAAFASRSKRPSEGDIITYEIVPDEKGRICAKNIRYAGNLHSTKPNAILHTVGIYYLVLFFMILVALTLIDKLSFKIIALYLTVSFITFVAYAIDKFAAKNDRWRTKENTLHILAIIGGWPGALLAQRVLRHKSRKQESQMFFWITVLINSIVLGWITTTEKSAELLQRLLDLT